MSPFDWVLVAIGIVLVFAICYLLYKRYTPEYVVVNAKPTKSCFRVVIDGLGLGVIFNNGTTERRLNDSELMSMMKPEKQK